MVHGFSDGLIADVKLAEDGSFTVLYRGPGTLEGTTIKYVPFRDDDNAIRWNCAGGTMPAKFRPPACRQ